MTFQEDMQELASELVAEFGAVATITKVTAASYNVSTGGYDNAVNTSYQVPCSPPDRYTQEEVNRFGLQGGDMKIIVPYTDAIALGFEPAIGDEGVFDGGKFTVVRVSPIYAGLKPAAWEVGLRW